MWLVKVIVDNTNIAVCIEETYEGLERQLDYWLGKNPKTKFELSALKDMRHASQADAPAFYDVHTQSSFEE